MKIRTRLVIAFLTVTVVPLCVFFLAFSMLADYRTTVFSQSYGLSERLDLLSSNSVQVFSRLTRTDHEGIQQTLLSDPDRLEDQDYLRELNENLQQKYAYLIVRKGDEIIFSGLPAGGEDLTGNLPAYGSADPDVDVGVYMDGDVQHLVKQDDFHFSDGAEGSVFIVSGFENYVPELRDLMSQGILVGIVILLAAAVLMVTWVYQSILKPLRQLQKATHEIKNGNLDFTMDTDSNDEIGRLCQDFEEMRVRLKESTEEKLQYDEESKALLMNISHDLKTPVTAIKGYAEGIMDGVASSPEMLSRYIRTIYNKANDMDRLVDELTFYSKIDTNKIPYTFSRINVANYFRDCVEEVGLDLGTNNIELGYFNYVDDDVVVVADAEQIKRVINNIIGNSVKYLDKKKGIINIRIKDVGDSIEVEIEDNGCGISAEDLPSIFDRFYRADVSRNSSKGGSGIGLSIAKKIIEDHGGKIWATSKEGIGTEIHFVLRKYQEGHNEEDSAD